MNDWIPVSERLPEDGGIFLVCTGSGAVLLQTYNTDKGWSAFGKDPVYWNNINTHWMPLPEPPENENGDN